MKLVILGCAVTTQVKEYDVEYLCITFNLTTDAPFGKRYGVTRNIPMVDAELYNKPYEEICHKVLVDIGKMMFRFRKTLSEEAENEDAITEEMRDLAIEGLAAFFSTHEWWSKNLREVHDIKAWSMVMDMVECEQYVNENDIRVITKVPYKGNENLLGTKGKQKGDWRKECCDQCKYHFIEHNGQKYPCKFSECSDEEVLGFDKANGCQGVYEYLKTGVFPERGRK